MLAANDAELVARAQGGDVDAVGELYDAHHEHIFRYVWSRVRDKQLAEDLTGETFTRMVGNLAGYRLTDVPFRAWLYRIARNLIVDHYRTENGRTSLPLSYAEDTGSGGSHPSPIVEQKLVLESVQEALAQIDPLQREVILLRFVTGLPLQEVALALDKTVAAVKALQHRGLKSLRVVLQQV